MTYSDITKRWSALRNAASAASFACLAACGTIGAPPIITASGPTVSAQSTGPAKRFYDSALAASAVGATPAQLHAMLLDGFSLNYANCNDFFSSAGDAQTWVGTARDIVQVLGTISVGLIALQDGSDDTVAGIAFGSNALYSGLDVYTRNFLFGAENIDEVRKLVLRALDAHKTAVLAEDPNLYGEVVQALVDNQAFCSPRRIASLAKEAIAKGQVVAFTPSDGPGQVQAQADAKVLERLGLILNLTGSVSTSEAGALWWYAIRSWTSEDLKIINTTLTRVPAAQHPLDAAGAPKGTWNERGQVDTQLRLLSPKSQQTLDAWITETRAADAAATKAAAAGLPAPPIVVAPPNLAAPQGSSKRVEIGIE